MYKINDTLSFSRDNHGYKLTQTHPTFNKVTKVEGVGSKDYFYPTLDQVAGKILHLCADDSKIELELEQLRNSYYECRANIANMLGDKYE